MTNNKPVKEFGASTVKAAVFERSVITNNAKKSFISKSVCLQVSYLDKEGNWHNNKMSIVRGDLDKVINVLTDASNYLKGVSK